MAVFSTCQFQRCSSWSEGSSASCDLTGKSSAAKQAKPTAVFVPVSPTIEPLWKSSVGPAIANHVDQPERSVFPARNGQAHPRVYCKFRWQNTVWTSLVERPCRYRDYSLIEQYAWA